MVIDRPELVGLVALQPSSLSAIVHLRLPGWKPSAKTRSTKEPLCGNFVGATPHGTLAEGLLWATSTDARGRPRRWCHGCLGRLVQFLGEDEKIVRAAQAVSQRQAHEQEMVAGGYRQATMDEEAECPDRTSG